MKNQLILGFALLISGIVAAQQNEHYLYFNVGGGYHNLNYTLQNGTVKGQAGTTFNAGYSFFFNPQWGLQSGIGIQSFNSLSTLNYLSVSPDVDTDGQTYDFRANYINWQEKQHSLFLEIPLSLQFRNAVNEKFVFLASAGAKISFPVNTGFNTSGGKLVTTGYYSQMNVELSDMPQHGFSTITNVYKGNLSLMPAYMAIVDVGGLIKLSEKTDLYIGGYFNYGLNNILKPDNKLIYQPTGTVNGVFTATYNGVMASNLTNKVIPMSFGIKVGIYWKLGKLKHTEALDELNVEN